jgi:hypothetical protein
VVADLLFALVQEGDSEFAAPFFIVADALRDAAARVEIYRNAANNFARGSAFQQRALAGIVKDADALPDAAARVAAYRDVVNNSDFGSGIAQQALAGIVKGFAANSAK